MTTLTMQLKKLTASFRTCCSFRKRYVKIFCTFESFVLWNKPIDPFQIRKKRHHLPAVKRQRLPIMWSFYAIINSFGQSKHFPSRGRYCGYCSCERIRLKENALVPASWWQLVQFILLPRYFPLMPSGPIR